MADVRIVGDEIYSSGLLVGMIVQSTSEHKILDEFVEHINNATLFEDEEALNMSYDTALDDLLKAAKLEARGGLLRIITLERIILQLKEDES